MSERAKTPRHHILFTLLSNLKTSKSTVITSITRASAECLYTIIIITGFRKASQNHSLHILPCHVVYLLRGSAIRVKNEGSMRMRIGRDCKDGSSVTERRRVLTSKALAPLSRRDEPAGTLYMKSFFISCEYSILYHTKVRLIPKKYILDSAKCLAMLLSDRYSFHCLCKHSSDRVLSHTARYRQSQQSLLLHFILDNSKNSNQNTPFPLTYLPTKHHKTWNRKTPNA